MSIFNKKVRTKYIRVRGYLNQLSVLQLPPVVMELIVDYEALVGTRNELVIKELAVASSNAINAFHFTSPYSTSNKVNELNKLSKNGLNWNDGYIPYTSLKLILEEATAGYTHLYAYERDKCCFISEVTNRAFINLEEFNCPAPPNLKHEMS